MAIDFEAEGLDGLDDGLARDARLELLRTLEHEGFTLEELRRATARTGLRGCRWNGYSRRRVLTTPCGGRRRVRPRAPLPRGGPGGRSATPRSTPDARVLTDEEPELARHAKTLLDAGLDEESFFELIRVMSHSLDSIAPAPW